MNKEEPLVTVVIAAYNSALYIADAIKSIINQDFPYWELIVVDDASADDTLLKVRSFTDERIHILCNDTNKGPSYSRNRAIQAARGKYIAILDSDDISSAHRLSSQIKIMEADSQIALLTGAMKILRGNEILRPPSDPEYLRTCLFFTNVIPHSSVLIRRTVLEETGLYPVDYRYGEDYRLYWQFIKKGLAISSIPAIAGQYRVHTNQITANKLESLSGFLQERVELFIPIELSHEQWEFIDLFLRNQVYFSKERLELLNYFFDGLYASKAFRSQFNSKCLFKIRRKYYLKMLKVVIKAMDIKSAFKILMKIIEIGQKG